MNKKVIYTAIFGDYDALQEPTIITPGWDYICYTDNPKVESNTWKVLRVSGFDGFSDTKSARYYKIMTGQGLYGMTFIWVDASIRIECNLDDFIASTKANSGVVVMRHPSRFNMMEESNECIKRNKDDRRVIESQFIDYIDQGYPDDQGMVATGLLVKFPSPEVDEFMDKWMDEVRSRSCRDQLSFGYALWKRPVKVTYIPYHTIKSLFKLGKHNHQKEIFYDTLVQKVKDKENFSFSRWGDGEWISLLGVASPDDRNCDGHRYFPDMGDRLASVLKRNPRYILGMQSLAMESLGDKINGFLSENRIKSKWVDADVFHSALIRMDFGRFIKALQNRNVIIVGPGYLRDLNIGYNRFIDIPLIDCWLKKADILGDVVEAIGDKKDCVVLFCAGMTANYLVDSLYLAYENEHTFIDMGSVLEPLVGIAKRKYQEDVIKKLRPI